MNGRPARVGGRSRSGRGVRRDITSYATIACARTIAGSHHRAEYPIEYPEFGCIDEVWEVWGAKRNPSAHNG